MEPLSLDTSVRVDAGVLNKLVNLAGELLAAREQLRAVRAQPGLAPAPDAADFRTPPTPTPLVLFATPDDGRMAIPLASVDRIEEFDAAAVFDDGPRKVVRHRGAVLPLIGVSALLPERRGRLRRRARRAAERGPRMQAIVVSARGRSVGLVVDRLIDVVEERIELAQPGSREGAGASALVHGRVTEIADLDMLLAAADEAWRESEAAPDAERREG